MGGAPLGAEYSPGEGLPSEEEAQEAETPVFRCPSQTPGNCPGVSPVQAVSTSPQDLPSVSVLGEWAVMSMGCAAKLLDLSPAET